MVALTGWSWDEAENTLTLPRFTALCAAFRRHPPPGALLAAWLGYHAPAETEKETDLAAFLSTCPGAVAEEKQMG